MKLRIITLFIMSFLCNTNAAPLDDTLSTFPSGHLGIKFHDVRRIIDRIHTGNGSFVNVFLELLLTMQGKGNHNSPIDIRETMVDIFTEVEQNMVIANYGYNDSNVLLPVGTFSLLQEREIWMTNLTQITESLERRHFFWNLKRRLLHNPVKQLTKQFIWSQLGYTRWFLEEIRYDFFTDSKREILLAEGYRSLLQAKVVIHQFGQMLQDLDELGYMSCVAKGLKEYTHFWEGQFPDEIVREKRGDLVKRLLSKMEFNSAAEALNCKDFQDIIMHFFLLWLSLFFLVSMLPGAGMAAAIGYPTLVILLHMIVLSRIYSEIEGQAQTLLY
ncbi:hypothetical protein NCAS_0A05540 [Naumovozyma castellii]|uniref:Uncharacterized protein n=1 Tax=Naumovozyma castellii TaxID=27288 RepID=G0V6L6_NAUCA|nr:hypothetical protein NCAS_0A05540 [Naumovozyma castellii CBS 4309]CCC67112.1 hypothetical protein NCAS_0A05540 [Naumovozyma castellii CBS 4309]